MTATTVRDAQLGPMPAGTVVGSRYRLLSLLGMGGDGEAWAGYDERLNRRVAVHLVWPNREEPGQFHHHVTTLAGLNHPTLVRLFDADEGSDDSVDAPTSGRPFLVTELPDGPTLAQQLHFAPLGRRFLASIALDLASALAYLHGSGVTGNPVCPGNVVISPGTRHSADRDLALDGAPLLKLNARAIGSTIGDDVDPAGRAAGDLYRLGAVLSEALGPRASSGVLRRLVSELLDPDPSARPSALEVCGRLAAMHDRRGAGQTLVHGAETML